MITLRLLLPAVLISVSFPPLHGQLPPAVVPPEKRASAADLNRDGSVDMVDVALLHSALGGSDATYDLNGDGTGRQGPRGVRVAPS